MKSLQTLGIALAAALLLGALTAPLAAQASDFGWELKNGKPGYGVVSGDNLVVLGPDGDCTSGSPNVWLETTAPVSGTVIATYYFTSFDYCCGGLAPPQESGMWDAPIFVVNGAISEVFTFCDSSGTMELSVEAGDTFGFGVTSEDCQFGPGLLEVKSIVFNPNEAPGARNGPRNGDGAGQGTRGAGRGEAGANGAAPGPGSAPKQAPANLGGQGNQGGQGEQSDREQDAARRTSDRATSEPATST